MDKHKMISDLMDQYGTSVLHLAYSYVRNRQTAEDLTQEIFLKCFENLDTYRGEAGLQTWLYRVASNHCKDYLKSWYFRKTHVTAFISGFFKDSQPGPEEQFLQNDENYQLQDALFNLPIKYREILFLYYFQECSQKEIGAICSLNVNTVKSRLTRARELLKKILDERSYEYGGSVEADKKQAVKGRTS
ncbi:sigma-70 family RNA polymerase sigma factor [Mesobacillus sp. AQ2]|uniref:sigma-70 family RNA polymerase sigma factor n=1 Tax=Mesobacillus sp. AQ2 TaxID=3043332 RepID=UPI0024C1C37B|nr:sigma-70 family RNA polymerase sigma factor [Mesobacillus sp. AQ2]WHX40401.1 sigma-70 family RNA polymerase sigma factor [Mesobacillus sp. AQ2]